jgi:hypothetical protein
MGFVYLFDGKPQLKGTACKAGYVRRRKNNIKMDVKEIKSEELD